MAITPGGGGSTVGAAPTFPTWFRERLRYLGVLVLLSALAAIYRLAAMAEGGPALAFSLLTGVALGIVFQRGRFCFFCIFRDAIEHHNSGPLYALLAALAVGGVGHAVLFGAFLPNAQMGQLPADAHIGPVSWLVAAAGLAFGLGMTLSGACISGHLYRLGEGYARAPLALAGVLLGMALAFFTWQSLYLHVLAQAPIIWLPATFGYGGALLLHLATPLASSSARISRL